MFQKIGSFAVRYRFWLVGAWILTALAMFLFAPQLSEVGSMDESAFLPADSEALEARQLIAEYFPEATSGSSVNLVFFNENGLGEADMAYAREVSDWFASGEPPFEVQSVTSIFTSPELAANLVSPDNTTMLLNAGLEQTAYESGADETIEAVREYLQSSPETLEVYVSGQLAIYADMMESLLRSIDLTTIVTIILVIVLLLAIYRSPLSVLVPLLTIGTAFIVSRGLLGIIADAGVSVWSQLDVFLIVLVFGVGTDYCLFLISRYREELAKHDSRAEAMKHTVGRIGQVIAASAFAVIVGLSAMAVARYQMIQTMGPLMALSIFVTLLAAITMAPALASIFGKALFWPRHAIIRSEKPKESGFWYRVAKVSTGRPVLTIIVLLVVLLIPYIAVPDLNRSYDQLAEIPQDTDSVRGFRVLEEHYNIGEMDPLTGIIVAGEGTSLSSPRALDVMESLAADLLRLEGVMKVQSIIQPEGNGQTPAGLTVNGQLASMAAGFESSGNDDTDPSFLFSEELDASLRLISAYLDELSTGFPAAPEQESYQAAREDLAAIETTLEQVRAGVLVENQLAPLGEQAGLVAAAPTGSEGMITEDAAGLAMLTKGYLDELAAAHPDLAAMEEFKSANTIVTAIGTALAASYPPGQLPLDVQQIMADLPGSFQQLSSHLAGLAEAVRGQGLVLISGTLAQASEGPSAANALQEKFSSLGTRLSSLADWFAVNGNPAFLSAVLLSTSEESSVLLDTFYSEDRQAMRFFIVLDSFPQSERAMDTVKRLRAGIDSSLQNTGLDISEAVIGGTSAEITDVQTILNEDFNVIMALVVAAIFIVLVILLRSLIAPVYLLITVLLSYGSTLGIVSWLFQGVLNHDGVSFMVPIIVFVLLVALGSDYNIFLMSRVREEAASHTPHLAARYAVMATGGVITACGIILAGTFGVLGITPIRTMVHIGAAVGIGVLLDTFLVRALLVPAIASLLGRLNWWPRRYGKR